MKAATHKIAIDLPRRFTAMLLVLSLAALGCYGSAPEEPPQPFQITAVSVEAMEGGPCVIDIKLSYRGAQKFYYWDLFAPNIVLPDNWVLPHLHGDDLNDFFEGGKPKYTFAPVFGTQEIPSMKPGDVVQKRCYLHRRRSTQILSGKARLHVSWRIRKIKEDPTKRQAMEEQRREGYAADGPAYTGLDMFRDTEEIGNPSIDLDLDVLPATPKNLSDLRVRLEQRLRPEASAKEIEDVASQLYNTRHRLLSPVAWRIIERSYCGAVDYARLFQVVDESTSEWEEVEPRLVRLANNSTDARRWFVFKYLAERNPAMTANAFTTLTSSDDIWTRVLTYLWFSKRCERLWVNDLLLRLPELTQPLPQLELSRLLRDLDDNDFRVRECAMNRLLGYGARVETQLKKSSQALISPEAKRRVHLILERIAARKEAPEWKPIIETLSREGCDREAVLAILGALAKGNPDAALTKSAVTSLQTLTRREGGKESGKKRRQEKGHRELAP